MSLWGIESLTSCSIHEPEVKAFFDRKRSFFRTSSSTTPTTDRPTETGRRGRTESTGQRRIRWARRRRDRRRRRRPERKTRTSRGRRPEPKFRRNLCRP